MCGASHVTGRTLREELDRFLVTSRKVSETSDACSSLRTISPTPAIVDCTTGIRRKMETLRL